MPTHSGLKLSLVSKQQYWTLPEFDHPETSQFTKRSPESNNYSSLGSLLPSAACDSKADKILGRRSSASVYVPFIPGLRFWVRVQFLQALPKDTPYLLCKLRMNGRLVQSAGFPAGKPITYQIMKGLFDPSEEYNYQDDNGTPMKNHGLERRAFFFSEDLSKSATEDGGVIEVQCFRAKGRQQKMQDPLEFKSQERYGITLPSGGLEDYPQDAKFYDWHLKDPKDKPYAIFKFYYRSWYTLTELQIVALDHSQRLISMTPSLMSLAGLSRDTQCHLDEEWFRELSTSDELIHNQATEYDDEEDENNESEHEEDEFLKERRIESYDEDFIFSSDVGDGRSDTASADGLSADAEDDRNSLREGSYTSEGDESASEGSEPAWNKMPSRCHSVCVAADQSTGELSSSINPKSGGNSASIEGRPPTPYNYEYLPADDGPSTKHERVQYFDLENEISSRRDKSLNHLNRALPEIPIDRSRKTSFSKPSLSKPLPRHSASGTDASYAQSNKTSSPSTRASPATYIRALTGSLEMGVERVADWRRIFRVHGETINMIDTPPLNERNSEGSSSTMYGGATSSEHMRASKVIPLGRVFPLIHATPFLLDDEGDTQDVAPLNKQYIIETTTSPLSSYLKHDNQTKQDFFTTFRPPSTLPQANTDPRKKSSRVASSDYERLPYHPKTALSPISERSSPNSPTAPHSLIPANNLPDICKKSMGERRLVDHLSHSDSMASASTDVPRVQPDIIIPGAPKANRNLKDESTR